MNFVGVGKRFIEFLFSFFLTHTPPSHHTLGVNEFCFCWSSKVQFWIEAKSWMCWWIFLVVCIAHWECFFFYWNIYESLMWITYHSIVYLPLYTQVKWVHEGRWRLYSIVTPNCRELKITLLSKFCSTFIYTSQMRGYLE